MQIEAIPKFAGDWFKLLQVVKHIHTMAWVRSNHTSRVVSTMLGNISNLIISPASWKCSQSVQMSLRTARHSQEHIHYMISPDFGSTLYIRKMIRITSHDKPSRWIPPISNDAIVKGSIWERQGMPGKSGLPSYDSAILEGTKLLQFFLLPKRRCQTAKTLIM